MTGVCHSDGTTTLWDLTNSSQLLRWKNHSDEGRSVSFSSDGLFKATGSFDHSIAITKTMDSEPLKVLKHDDKVVCVRWHPFLPILVSTAADSTARVWTA